ncbi:MAG TPA: hypothetical protein DCR55_03025 [Lentisphaeria bacterium]|jgi:CheY-like chemotaxis protein|nr:hypothetical protein [Lentisphaeria bacterium]
MPFSQPPKILLVDDRPENLFALEHLLASLGAEVVQANSGNEALTATLNHEFALILMDVQMPEMDGFEVAQYLRMAESTSVTPIIFLTANSQTTEDECRGYASGAVDYILKPINEAALLSKVRIFLDLYRGHQMLKRENESLERKLTNTATIIVDRPTKVLAGYSLLRTLGRGSIGTVYLAERDCKGVKRKFALKVLRNRLPDSLTDQLTQRFMREAEAASRVKSSHVVSIVDYGIAEDERVPYIVMERINGQSLKQLLAKRKIRLEESVCLLRQLASALKAIHEAGIFHRDIKPENIMIENENNAKVTDFGIAKLPESELTQTSHLMGTLPYMAPEQFASANIGAQADLFSLGVMAYEMICGERPFQCDGLIDYSTAILHELPKSPREFVPDLPDILEYALARLLKKRADERYATASELLRDLDLYAKGKSIRSRLVTVLHRDGSTNWAEGGG